MYIPYYTEYKTTFKILLFGFYNTVLIHVRAYYHIYVQYLQDY